MTKKALQVRDRFTFSLTGIPVAGYGILPVISNDRIRMAMKGKSESPQKAQGAKSEAQIPADALEGEYA